MGPSLRIHTSPVLHLGLLVCALLLLPTRLAGGESLTRDQVTPERAKVWIGYIHQILAAQAAGQTPNFSPPPDALTQSSANGVQILIVKNGTVLGSAHSRRSTLLGNLRLAAGTLGTTISPADRHEATLVLCVFLPPSPQDGTARPAIFLRPAIGAEGVEATYKNRSAYTPPLTPLLEEQDWLTVLLSLGETASGISSKTPAQRSRLLRSVISTPGFKVTPHPSTSFVSSNPSLLPTPTYRLHRLIEVRQITPETLQRSLKNAHRWYFSNQKASGFFYDKYDPRDDTLSETVDVTRQVKTLQALAHLQTHRPDPLLASMTEALLASLIREAYRENDNGTFGYIREVNRITLGPSAMTLDAILTIDPERRDPERTRIASMLQAFLLAQLNPDGRFATYYVPPEKTGRIGEVGHAQSALLKWARATNTPDLAARTFTSFRFYREYLWNHLKDRPPPYALVPTTLPACHYLYIATRRREIPTYAYRAAALYTSTTQQIYPSAQQSLPEDGAGRIFYPADRRTGHPSVEDTATAVTGLSHALALARAADSTTHIEQIRTSLLWGIRYLLQNQVQDGTDLLLVPTASRALGGFRRNGAEQTIRLDQTSAAVTALSTALSVLTAEDYQAAADPKQFP